MTPDKAFILAAGFGTRMRPLTLSTPKPVLEIGGVSLLHRALEKLEAQGVTETVVNAHYLADQIENAVKSYKGRMTCRVSREDEILDTGGGIAHGLAPFHEEPFYVLAGDSVWIDDPAGPALKSLAETWDPGKMDILILLQRTQSMTLTPGTGDYHLRTDGRAVRSPDKSGAFMFTSIRINHPRIFKNCPTGPFSYLDLLDKAEAEGRLYGLEHKGIWHHISCPGDLERVNRAWQDKERQSEGYG